MDLVLPVILCFMPLILCIALFCLLFQIKLIHQITAVLLGLGAILPISLIQFFMPEIPLFSGSSLAFVFLKSFLLYGLIEEIISFAFLFLLPHKNYSRKNFLFLAFIIGLSLGCFESLVYFLDHLQKSNALGGVLLYKPIFTRMFTADLLHTFCAGLLGLFIFEKRNSNPHVSIIVTTVFIHGLYDFFAGFHNFFWIFSIAVILFAAIECRIKYSAFSSSEKQI